eukprot:gb/GECG01006130.1/.p1 GENE.gb/GECG01006130.1/~~gb/GECG01006130.1/.p1  ORF type:complete len:151 (+),score=6.02 gb/GECG01006130.1/:1-453(+)
MVHICKFPTPWNAHTKRTLLECPLMLLALQIANIADLNRPAEKISMPQQTGRHAWQNGLLGQEPRFTSVAFWICICSCDCDRTALEQIQYGDNAKELELILGKCFHGCNWTIPANKSGQVSRLEHVQRALESLIVVIFAVHRAKFADKQA